MWTSNSAQLMRLGQRRLEFDVTPSLEVEPAPKPALARDTWVGNVQP